VSVWDVAVAESGPAGSATMLAPLRGGAWMLVLDAHTAAEQGRGAATVRDMSVAGGSLAGAAAALAARHGGTRMLDAAEFPHDKAAGR
jgi:hypothetical protein